MSARDLLLGVLEGILDFGRVTATSQSGSNKTVAVTLEGNAAAGATAAETRATQTLWGNAAVQMRPKPDTAGSFEVVFLRRGEEMVPLASREIRWQVDLAEGDVCIRNLDGTKPVRLWLKADGTALLEADEVKIGDSGATQAIGLGTAIKGHFDALKTYIDAHKHVYVDDAAGAQLTTPPCSAPPAVLDPSPSVPDVESRHKVEN